MLYHVDYEIDGTVKTASFDAYDIGQAYVKCLKKNPGSKIVSGHTYRKWAGGETWMNYESVSTKVPEPLPKEPRAQSEMELNDPRKEKPKRGRSSPVPIVSAI